MDAKTRKKLAKKKAKEDRRQEAVESAEIEGKVAPKPTGPAKWGQAAEVTVKRLNGLYESTDEDKAGEGIDEFDAVVGMKDRHGTELSLEVLRGTVAGCIADTSKAKPTPIQAPKSLPISPYGFRFALFLLCLLLMLPNF